MTWLIENWFKATPFLALFTALLLVAYVADNNWPLFLIWVHLPVYFLHQFEEYVLPGGFLETFNREMLKSDQPAWPLTPTGSFWINIPIIFAAYPLTALAAGYLGLGVGLWLAYFSVVNALSHVGMAVRRGYNPGLAVSVLLNIPIGAFAIWYLSSNGFVSASANIAGLVIGLAVQGVVMFYGLRVLKPKVHRV